MENPDPSQILDMLLCSPMASILKLATYFINQTILGKLLTLSKSPSSHS